MSRPATAPARGPRRLRRPRPAAPPAIVALGTALPHRTVGQDDARAFAAALFGEALGTAGRRLLQVFARSGVERRRACMPLEWYARPRDLAETSRLHLEHGLALSGAAARRALARARMRPRDVDHVVMVTSTGVAAPSLDAHLAGALGFRSDVRRTPLWGLGCAGGAAGLARARDFALAEPESRVLLVAVELCTLTFQPGDLDRRNLVAAALFADGAAAAVVCGARARRRAGSGAGPQIELLGATSTLWPGTLDVMGWTVDATGLHVVFSPDIPALVRERARPALDELLAAHRVALPSIRHWIVHPGGPRVLGAFAEALDLPPRALRHARAVLRSCGNLSSPTCLFVLRRALRAGAPAPGDLGVIVALGPGFAAETLLIRAA